MEMDKKDFLIEYQKAQDSAEHHDHLLWTVTSIIWAGSLVLMGFVLDKLIQKNSHAILTILSIFGILLILCMYRFSYLFSKIRNQKYERCKKIEELFNFTQHRDLKYPKCAQTTLYYFINLLFIIVWIIIILKIGLDKLIKV